MLKSLQTCDKKKGRQREAKPAATKQLPRLRARTPCCKQPFGEFIDQHIFLDHFEYDLAWFRKAGGLPEVPGKVSGGLLPPRDSAGPKTIRFSKYLAPSTKPKKLIKWFNLGFVLHDLGGRVASRMHPAGRQAVTKRFLVLSTKPRRCF